MKAHLPPVALFALAAAATALAGTAQPEANPTATGYVPCKIIEKAPAVFPVRLLNQGVIRGEVHLMLEVDVTGQLTDSLVVAYTHREFANEAQRVVGLWRFEPGFVDRKPVTSIVSLTFHFETAGPIAYTKTGPDAFPEAVAGEYVYQPHGVKNLDHSPVRIATSAPHYFTEWASQGRAGRVTVDFFIDESGQARMPTATTTDDELLAASAIAAVKQWRFERPTHQGKPVLVHAQQVFVFAPDPPDGKKP
jgi:TonB family protein